MTSSTMLYRLIGRLPVPCGDVLEWGRWMEAATRDGSRFVRQEMIGPLYVSTVFIGIDHRLSLQGPPLIFETMIFDGGDDDYQERFTTWDEAEAGHARAVAEARRRLAAADALLTPAATDDEGRN